MSTLLRATLFGVTYWNGNLLIDLFLRFLLIYCQNVLRLIPLNARFHKYGARDVRVHKPYKKLFILLFAELNHFWKENNSFLCEIRLLWIQELLSSCKIQQTRKLQISLHVTAIWKNMAIKVNFFTKGCNAEHAYFYLFNTNLHKI